MLFLYSLMNELKKNILTMRFIFISVIVACICFTVTVFTDNFGKSSTAAEAVFAFDTDFKASNGLTFENIFNKSLNGPFTAMFICALSAAGCVSYINAERKSGNLRFILCREGKMRYAVSKYISALICGGIAVAIGVSIFMIIVKFSFPMELTERDEFSEMTRNIPIKTMVIKSIVSAFIYGAASVLPSLLIVNFSQNTYMAVSIPYMLAFIHKTSLARVGFNSRLNNFILNTRLSAFSGIVYEFGFKKLLAMLFILCGVFAVFFIGIERRQDYAQ